MFPTNPPLIRFYRILQNRLSPGRVASIRLYVETLQTRDVDENHRKQFYSVMLTDTARLLRTVEQVLQAY